jgi:NAD(P)-dependent dehydrogenase (short-subunit alcohol dehydrogenase family)
MAEAKNEARVALVTGASAGIGQATVRRLLTDGWTVWGAARRLERMAGLEAAGARTLAMDVTDDASLRAGVAAIVERNGRIDALVNNAGYGSYGAVEDVPIEEARRQFEVNVFGLSRLTQLVLPTMRAQRSGTIVNVSSMAGRIWTPIGGWYYATKHALEVLSDVLRMEVRPFGIRVVVVQPGSIATEWGPIAAGHLSEYVESTPYRAWSEAMARALARPPMSSPPEVIARVIARAVAARRPRRRYAVPFDARLFVFLRRILPDALWERGLSLVVR